MAGAKKEQGLMDKVKSRFVEEMRLLKGSMEAGAAYSNEEAAKKQAELFRENERIKRRNGR